MSMKDAAGQAAMDDALPEDEAEAAALVDRVSAAADDEETDDAPDEAFDEDAGDEDESDDEDADPEAPCEIEHEGKTYTVPACLKDAFMRHSDYTKKTQGLAEHRRALEHREHSHHAHFRDVAQLVALDDAVRHYENIDWDTYAQSNPQGALQHWRQLAVLKDRRAQAAHHLQQKEQHKTTLQQRETARLTAEGRAALARDIPDFSPELSARLVDFGTSNFGLTREELANVTDPRLVKVLHAALKGHETGKAHAKLKQTLAAQQTRPATQVRPGSSSTTKDPNRMTDAQYRKWRESHGA